MTTPNNLNAGERFSIAITSFLRAVVRLVLILLAAGILGGLAYFGFVFIYQQAVLPAQENASRISVIETRQANNQSQLNQRLENFQQRLTALENQYTIGSESLTELNASQELMQAGLEEQAARLELLDQLQSDLGSLRTETDKALDLAQKNQATLSNGSLLAGVERDIKILKAASLLNRARLYMLQNNYGLAAQEIEVARELLASLEGQGLPEQQAALTVWLGRLDSALANLPDAPVIASDDLEIAWLLLVSEGQPVIPTRIRILTATETEANPTTTLTAEGTETGTETPPVPPTPGTGPTATATPTP